MKKVITLLLLMLIFSTSVLAVGKTSKKNSSSSGSGDVGVGLIVGSFNGLNLRFLGSANSAVNLDLAWNHDSDVLLAADYIINNKKPIQSLNGFPIYYGLGLKACSGDDSLGFRFILGTNFRLTDIDKNLELFLELAPGLTVIDHTDGYIDLGLGLRYYF